MLVSRVPINCAAVTDWPSFHAEFARTFGFPPFYGKNMDAWIDCMTYLDDQEAGMSSVHWAPGTVLTIELIHAADFAQRCPEQYAALCDCTAFVNRRRSDVGKLPILALDPAP